MKIFNLRNALGVALASAVLLVGGCGGGGGGGGSSSSSSTTTTSKPVASILLTTSQSKIKSDGSDSTTVKATALDADHAAIAKAVITFKADSGALSAGSVTAGTDGAATVTFTAGSADPSSRTATITASVGSVSQQIPVVISGATISVTSAATSLVVGGTSSTVTATLKDASGNPLANTTVSFASSGSGSVTLSPASGKTNSSGQLVVAVNAATPGTAVVTATGAGEKATTAEYVVTSTPGAAFTITSHPSKSASASLETPITITVQAPSSSRVTFVSSLGGWDSTGRNTISKAVGSNGTVSADLKASIAGVATVQIYDEAKPSTVDKMTVAFSASLANAYRITIQATPTVVPQTLGSTSGVSTLIATVTDLSGNPVGDAPVAFEIIKNTGGGETVSPAIVMTAGTTSSGQVLGQAKSTFTAGSLSSTTGGVVIRASVVGKSLTTSIAPSGDDAKLTIGGTAGSVSIGRATVTEVGGNNSLYIMPMSVVVADSNGNSVVGAKVSLSSFPIAFNAGGGGCDLTSGYGDFLNEDRNENQALDPGEDGLRTPYPLGVTGLLSTNGVVSTSDGKLTPPNSASGTLPSTVTTDASGVATFNLTYTKSNALWIFARIRASVIVLGTETVGESVFRLPALDTDIGPPCRIPNSPYLY